MSPRRHLQDVRIQMISPRRLVFAMYSKLKQTMLNRIMSLLGILSISLSRWCGSMLFFKMSLGVIHKRRLQFGVIFFILLVHKFQNFLLPGKRFFKGKCCYCILKPSFYHTLLTKTILKFILKKFSQNSLKTICGRSYFSLDNDLLCKFRFGTPYLTDEQLHNMVCKNW